MMFSAVPELPGFSGIQRMVVDGIMRSDQDTRKELFGNIVISGGNSMIDGFVERTQKLVTEIIPQNMKAKIVAHPPPERKLSPWIGGSILSSLGSFNQMWMTKKEFEEHGAYFIERKCA
jgi:actin-related protein